MRILPVLLLLFSAAASAQPAPPPTVPAPPDVAAPPADAIKTATGLATKVIAPGKGTEHPAKDDVVTIHYTGWKTDGTMFDSSVTKGKPSSFPVGRVIAGFSEGLQLMVPGEKRRLWIPEALAYKGAREPKGMLVFDIQLLDIPTRAPADVKAAPADAKKTPSGLAYKVLTQGVGGRHPRPSSEVTVHYTGWTTDGKMFDSSVVRGQPSTFSLDGVIPGWTEGLQLMFEGEKTRFWIPEKLAYEGKKAPYGLLVFDVELIKIVQ
ncbi:MAG TPA: FKBP-type peptidyl-prolyl cis-trans isomerase [Vicinamibacterales bacterium]|nr:FKBP-type peptidyl-prolyl cis-trans isomerase [Vicinamibacterales bacterium]